MGRIRSAKVQCPCCGYRTLMEHGAFEICILCWWEDDGQADRDADEIRGGPNGGESLTSARQNFRDHLTMYPRDADRRIGGTDTAAEVEAKRMIMNALDFLQDASAYDAIALWNNVNRAETALEAETDKKVQAFERRENPERG
jgi:hypothetical protein